MAFRYQLDPCKVTQQEIEVIREQVAIISGGLWVAKGNAGVFGDMRFDARV